MAYSSCQHLYDAKIKLFAINFRHQFICETNLLVTKKDLNVKMAPNVGPRNNVLMKTLTKICAMYFLFWPIKQLIRFQRAFSQYY